MLENHLNFQIGFFRHSSARILNNFTERVRYVTEFEKHSMVLEKSYILCLD